MRACGRKRRAGLAPLSWGWHLPLPGLGTQGWEMRGREARLIPSHLTPKSGKLTFP